MRVQNVRSLVFQFDPQDPVGATETYSLKTELRKDYSQ